MKYILASASPRRKELLEQIGLEFEIIPACGEEIIPAAKPEEVVMDLSRQKAGEIAEKRAKEAAPEVIIGADTVVAYGNEILGKPRDKEDAYRMISLLQGNCHKVYTGVTLILRTREDTAVHSFFEETEVVMYPMSRSEREWYIATGEPFDKAGGYGIQGRCAVFIEKIQGDYNNVVGLPVARIYRELLKLGVDIYGKSYYDDGKK